MNTSFDNANNLPQDTSKEVVVDRASKEFRNLEYYAAGLLVVALLGFWRTYFSKFFDGSASFSQYFHFHAVTALLWVLCLIAQPLLIRLKRRDWHRMIGRFSYGLVPLIFISVMLLAHHRNSPNAENVAQRLWIPFKDLLVFSFGYGVAIVFRKSMPIHARGMIVAGMSLIEPAMVRVFYHMVGIGKPLGYYLGITPVYIILTTLIVLERKAVKGRWVFPCALGLFLFVHVVKISGVVLPGWGAFAHWFMSLPLT